MYYRPREEEKRIKRISVWVTESEHQRLRMMAAQRRMTMTNLIMKAFNFYLKNNSDESGAK